MLIESVRVSFVGDFSKVVYVPVRGKLDPLAAWDFTGDNITGILERLFTWC